MAYEILMPKLSSTMAEGSITQWLKEVGDSIEVGEAIFEVMTDKIAIEVESYEEGILLARYYEVDESAPINSIVGYIGEAGEEVPETAPAPPSEEGDAKEDLPLASPTETIAPAIMEATVSSGKVRATPAARKLAREKGIALQQVSGSGTNGRVHVSDVEEYQAPVSSLGHITGQQETVIPWRGMRKAIADSMLASTTTIPHVTMDAQVDLTEVIKLRQELLPVIEGQTEKRLGYLEIIIKAVCVTLPQFPRLNARALEDGIHEFSQVNMGVAVALDDGLIVPVVHGANHLGLGALTTAVKEVVSDARQGQLTGEQLSGATFTISSLGQGAVRRFNPVINAPEVAILGVSSLFDAPYRGVTGELEMRPSITLSLSFDHRAIDGAPVADFLSALVNVLDNPYRLLV